MQSLYHPPPELQQLLIDQKSESVRVRVRWALLPEDRTKVSEQVVLELTQGRITDVLIDRTDLDIDYALPTTLLMPRLANLHTHLEFSQLQQPLRPTVPFADWIRSVIGYRNSIEDRNQAIQTGLIESSASYAGLLGEIWTQDQFDVYLQNDRDNSLLQMVLFREVIGIHPDQWPDRLERITNAITALRSAVENTSQADRLLAGVSPHAPYTVHPDLFRAVCRYAASEKLPLAFHLAETVEELELLKSQSGPIRELLDQFGLWSEDIFNAPMAPLDYLRELAEVPHALLIHCNYLNREEQDELATQPQTSVVYCPRTHAYFQHTPHPWQQLQDRGIRVVLGTDGRCSNPDLNLLEEARFLMRQHPSFNPITVLRMMTYEPRLALGNIQLAVNELLFVDLKSDDGQCPARRMLCQ